MYCETDDEKIVDSNEQFDGWNHRSTCTELLDFPSQQQLEPAKDEDVDTSGMRWRFNGRMTPPINVSRGVVTKLKPDAKMKFINPLASFLASLPIEFWK